jgi:spermidine/putrescine transport system permease protein
MTVGVPAAANAELDAPSSQSVVPTERAGRARLLTGVLMLPATLWYLFLLLVPLVIVTIFSFGVRGRDGGYQPAFTLDNYDILLKRPQPFVDSLVIASLGTLLCLFVALPLAYFIATRVTRRKTLFLVLLIIPFWTSFLVRTIAWLIILGPQALSGFLSDATGADIRLLGTQPAVLLGIVYNYLPLMIFPLYVTLERLDPALLEASKDLGAGRWATFRQITLPLCLPGLITGSILVFIPLMGEYVIPSLLGLGKVFLIGNVLQLDFLGSRNWPAGSAKAVALIVIMLITVTFYLWSTNRGRTTRDVSLL